jgi:hypothetical protein
LVFYLIPLFSFLGVDVAFLVADTGVQAFEQDPGADPVQPEVAGF